MHISDAAGGLSFPSRSVHVHVANTTTRPQVNMTAFIAFCLHASHLRL